MACDLGQIVTSCVKKDKGYATRNMCNSYISIAETKTPDAFKRHCRAPANHKAEIYPPATIESNCHPALGNSVPVLPPVDKFITVTS